MSITTTSTGGRSAGGSRPRVSSRLLAVGAGVGVALAGWAIADQLAGVDMAVRVGAVAPQQVGPVSVVVVSLLAGLAAWAVLAVLERRTRHGRRAWTVLALVVLALSLSGPVAGGITVAAKVALALLHVALAAVLIPLLLRSRPTR